MSSADVVIDSETLSTYAIVTSLSYYDDSFIFMVVELKRDQSLVRKTFLFGCLSPSKKQAVVLNELSRCLTMSGAIPISWLVSTHQSVMQFHTKHTTFMSKKKF